MSPEMQSLAAPGVATIVFGIACYFLKGVADDVKKAVATMTGLVPRVEGVERGLGKLEGKLEALQAQREREAGERAALREREVADLAGLKAQVAQNTRALEGYHAKANELQGQLRELFKGAAR